MSESAASAVTEVPTFTECVLGYRAWRIDDQDRLWPISDRRRAWEPGINTARCNCVVPGTLSFDWSWRDGRRVLEPHPRHEAPSEGCTCGLYSWRRPRQGWKHNRSFASASTVWGAVASWGRLQVHGPGFRAEHACVVTLAYPPSVSAEAMKKLARVAQRYRVELVPLDRLEEAASRHGSPLPDSLRPEGEPEQPPTRPRPDEQPGGAGSRLRRSPRPGLEPLPTRDRLGLALIGLSGGAEACGSFMWLGRGSIGWVGAALVAGGAVGICLTLWWLEPHKAAKHVGHRIRHHARNAQERRRKARQRSQPTMTDAEFEALEDALEPLYKHGNDMSNGVGPYQGL